MIHKTTITADTTKAEDITSEVEIEIVDNQIVDLIFSSDELDSDDKFFFAYEAMKDLNLSAENDPSDFIS